MTKKTTFCISTHNDLNYLKLCVESLEKNCFSNEYNIYIYSEGSIDGTDEWLKQTFSERSDVKFWCKPERWNDDYWGVGGGFRFLAEKVKTKYMILLHADMYCSPEFDRPLIENIKPNLIISSHRIEPDVWNNKIPKCEVKSIRPGTLCAHKDYFGYTYKNFDTELFETFANQFTYNNNKIYRKGEGAGGFIICKETYDKIGHPDPLFSPASYEDMDWFIRAQLKGVDFILTCKSLLWHFSSRSCNFPNDDFSKISERQKFAEIENRKNWLTKWNKMFTNDKVGFVSSNNMKIIDANNKYR